MRFAETDAMGIVHHSRYLPIMEEARVAYLRHIGHPYQSIREEGLDIAVLEVFLQYRQPIRFDEVVDVHCRSRQVDRATFQMAYLVTRGRGEVRATGVTAPRLHHLGWQSHTDAEVAHRVRRFQLRRPRRRSTTWSGPGRSSTSPHAAASAATSSGPHVCHIDSACCSYTTSSSKHTR